MLRRGAKISGEVQGDRRGGAHPSPQKNPTLLQITIAQKFFVKSQ